MKPRRRKKRTPQVPGQEWARQEHVERIANEDDDNWRERVFAFLFDPSYIVRDEAATWLLLEPEMRRMEHEIVLADPTWDVRYHAGSGWLRDPECVAAPAWMPDLFSAALARERNGTVFRQLVLTLARWAPGCVPIEVPHRVRAERDYAVAELAFAEIKLGRSTGWPRLHTLFANTHNVPGVAWAAMFLASEVEEGEIKAPTLELREYAQALARWRDAPTLYPNRMRGTARDIETLTTWLNTQDSA